MPQSETVLRVTNNAGFHVGVGGQSFPADTKGRVVTVRGTNYRQIIHCRYLDVEVISGDPTEGHETADPANGAAPVLKTANEANEEGLPDSPDGEENNVGGEGEQVVIQTHEKEEKEIKATEAALRIAKQLGVNLATVEGTGKDGQITKSDVEEASA